MKFPMVSKKESTALETAMYYIFSVGLIITFMFAIASIVFLYRSQSHIDLLKESGAFIHQQNFFYLIISLIQRKNIPSADILFATLGMISLVLAALLAVATACIYFLSKKNIKYGVITFVIMTILVISLALH